MDFDWKNLIHTQDHGVFLSQWSAIVEKHECQTRAQVRLTRVWDTGDGTMQQTWADLQTYAELGSSGVDSVFCTMSDISKFKWAEELQRSRIHEALDAKRKQEKCVLCSFHNL